MFLCRGRLSRHIPNTVSAIGIPCEGIVGKNNGNLHSSCQICTCKNPVISDEHWAYFEAEVSKCIRCYACRQSCPSCYCQSCFVDQSQPAWFGKTTNLSDTGIFHIVRALHMAGRCVDCVACNRACPMDIYLRKLTLKMEQEVKDRFGYVTGMNEEEPAPLAIFKTDDSEDYMRQER